MPEPTAIAHDEATPDHPQESNAYGDTTALVMSILPHLTDPQFRKLYFVGHPECLDVCALMNSTPGCLLLDLLTRCPPNQLERVGTFKFVAQEHFEKQLVALAGTQDKSDSSLPDCRPWDVALNVTVKVEALGTDLQSSVHSFMLRREAAVMHFLWKSFAEDKLKLDAMTGLPLIFDYRQVPNSRFKFNERSEFREFDMYGTLVPMEMPASRTSLSYLTVEKTGPTLEYLMDLAKSANSGRGFDFQSAFQVFDQLVCRCLQLHRFGVVHRAVEPQNVAFGRGSACNVVYLVNFRWATVFDPTDPNCKKKGSLDGRLFASPRFAPKNLLRSNCLAHPFYDLESAFYTLAAMLTDRLPWDQILGTAVLDDADNLDEPKSSELSGLTVEPPAESTAEASSTKSSNQTSCWPKLTCHSAVRASWNVNAMQRLKEAKNSFWSSKNAVNSILKDMEELGDGPHLRLAQQVVRDVHGCIRDLVKASDDREVKPNFFQTIKNHHTKEYQLYIGIRRAVLKFFRFESFTALIGLDSNLTKATCQEPGEAPVVAWNAANWCFTGYALRTHASAA